MKPATCRQISTDQRSEERLGDWAGPESGEEWRHKHNRLSCETDVHESETELKQRRMEALIASYGDSSSDSDASPPRSKQPRHNNSNTEEQSICLPPPPLALLDPPNSLGYLETDHGGRERSFPRVEGNFALHVFIPVHIPATTRKELFHYLKKAASLLPGLHVVDVDILLNNLCKDDQKLEQVALGREFHISLGRTVPIRAHQIDSMVSMLCQKLQSQKRYWIDFSKWEVFVNDDHTRSFLSMEVAACGLAEVRTFFSPLSFENQFHFKM
uniref:U6 snRNA phosphodiesterase 1 n=1 Tax=Nelumbo nucifera TaxID=4432 RepID=A0A822ZW61_NELNU|nr:TPA_asm: hypothetical protein HUJ06_017073 [Nelumbo nucifera]